MQQQQTKPYKRKIVDMKMRNTFTIWHYLCEIKFLHKWLLRNKWMKVTSTCHMWDIADGEKVGEYEAIHWRVVDKIT